jgi:hypothetical protein
MNQLRYTLLSDGSSDRALLPVLDWLLQQCSTRVFERDWADLRHLRQPPQTLRDRIGAALHLYSCDLLFVHRDAERESYEVRIAEIRRCLLEFPVQPAVCVVPVRMQEAWLLFDEQALRRAAGNPSGREPIALPPLGTMESLVDPKHMLHDLLRLASGLRSRRRLRFDTMAAAHRLATLIQDFSPLRGLPAFRALEDDLRVLLAERSWT